MYYTCVYIHYIYMYCTRITLCTHANIRTNLSSVNSHQANIKEWIGDLYIISCPPSQAGSRLADKDAAH